ncbi:hypothetical protein [Halocola ammonii]
MKQVLTTTLVAVLVILCADLSAQSETADRTLLPEPSGLKNDIFHQSDTSRSEAEIVSTMFVLNMLQNFGHPKNLQYDMNEDGKVDEIDLRLLIFQSEEQE